MLNPLLNLLFPKQCFACKQTISGKVNYICVKCRNELSNASLLLNKKNPIKQILSSGTQFQQSISYLKFEQNGKIQNILHALKYQGIKELGVVLGELSAQDIRNSNFFDSIDLIMPVPIHSKKKRKRGYNQSEYIAKGISSIPGIPSDSKCLIKLHNTKSQTKKSRYDRFKNVSGSFQLQNSQQLIGKHLLLVDDVITTGATIEACSKVFSELEEVQLSLLTIACTY